MKKLSRRWGSVWIGLCLLSTNVYADTEAVLEKAPLPPAVMEETLTQPKEEMVITLPKEVDWEAEAEDIRRARGLSDIPAAFDLREYRLVSSVKDRRKDREKNAWAFASIGALESRLMIDQEYDFSENNLLRNNGCTRNLEKGNKYLGLAYFTSQKGPVKEEFDPYEHCCSAENLPVTKTVQEAYFVDSSKIKEMIWRHKSAVQMSLHMNVDPRKDQDPRYYNKKEAAQFVYRPNESLNEEILIVGWNDDYSRNNFAVPPLEDGAFICKHSRGYGFGKGGYFYVSYMDKSLRPPVGYQKQDGIIYVKVGDRNQDLKLYQHDEYGMVGTYGNPNKNEIWFANVFEKRSPYPHEILRSVSFYTLSDDLRYEIWLQRAGDTIRNLEMVDSGTIQNRGYHTIDLPREELLSGTKFTVAVKLYTNERNSVAIEYEKEDVLDRVFVDSKQSFVSEDGQHWTDLSDTEMWVDQYLVKGANVCLKAFTEKAHYVPPLEPDFLKRAHMYGYYYTDYIKKAWNIKFSVDVDPISAEKEIRLFEKESFKELNIHKEVNGNIVTIYLKPNYVNDRYVERFYERGKEYIIYIGRVRGKDMTGQAGGVMQEPLKAIFVVN